MWGTVPPGRWGDCWNHETCLMDCDWEHLAPATLRHRHLKPSLVVGSAHQVISRPHMLQGTLLQMGPTSFRYWIPRSFSLNRNVRIDKFTDPLIASALCLYDLLGTYGISTICRWYSERICFTFSTIFHRKLLHYTNWQCNKRFTELPAHHAQRYSWLAVEKTRAEVVGVTKKGEWMHFGNEASNGG